MIAIGLLLLAAPQTSQPPAPEGRLLFTRQLDRRDDLFVLHLPEGRVERLTDHRAKDSHGAVSPDGLRVVFNSERAGWWKIWLADADGTDVEQLTRPASGADSHPCWSPDGLHVLYVRGSNGKGELVRLTLADGASTNLTRNPARDHFPAWRPTGGRIAFASDRDGAWSMYTMDESGGDVARLTTEGEAIEPAWFPDGRRLAYRAHTQSDSNASHLWTIDVDPQGRPGEARPLTSGDVRDEQPAVSPDGAWIAFESDRAGGSQLFLIPAAGGEPRQLTREGYCYAASWFPRERQAGGEEGPGDR
jgi:TolB protein